MNTQAKLNPRQKAVLAASKPTMSWTVGKRRVRRTLEPDAIFGRLCDAATDEGVTFHFLGVFDSYGALDCRIFVNTIPDVGHDDIWPEIRHKRWRLDSWVIEPRSFCGEYYPDIEERDKILTFCTKKALEAALKALESPAEN